MVEAKELWKSDESNKKNKAGWKKARQSFRELKQKHEELLSAKEPEVEEAPESEPAEGAGPVDAGQEEKNDGKKGASQGVEPVRLFAANLSYSIDEDTLTEVFTAAGIAKEDILKIVWGEDKETCEFKGYAHIDFANSAVAEAALALTKTKVLGR